MSIFPLLKSFLFSYSLIKNLPWSKKRNDWKTVVASDQSLPPSNLRTTIFFFLLAFHTRTMVLILSGVKPNLFNLLSRLPGLNFSGWARQGYFQKWVLVSMLCFPGHRQTLTGQDIMKNDKSEDQVWGPWDRSCHLQWLLHGDKHKHRRLCASHTGYTTGLS